MNQTDVSPVAEGLLMTHKIISRGLTVSHNKCNEFLENKGFPSNEATGFSSYVSTLKWVTHAHHLSEDEVAFPCFKDYVQAPFNRLKEDHLAIANVLDRMEGYLSDLKSDGIAGLRDALSEFQTLWFPHIKIEEENFTAQKVNEVMSMKDQVMIAKKLGEHGSRNAGPGPLALPFMFYNLEGKDRENFMRPFPAIVTKLLVPVIWKSKWKPMKPFLL